MFRFKKISVGPPYCRVWHFSTRSRVHKSKTLRCRCAKILVGALEKPAKKSGKNLAKYSVNTTFRAKIGCKICYKPHLGVPRFSCSKILGCAVDKLCSLVEGTVTHYYILLNVLPWSCALLDTEFIFQSRSLIRRCYN